MDIPNSGSGTASQTVADLANSTVYTFQVRAVNDAGEADASNEAEVTTSAAADDCAGGSGTFCSVTLGTSASGSIEVGGDSDWFELMGQVGGGATCQIDLRGAPSNNGTLEDPAIAGIYTRGAITELNAAGRFPDTYNDDISASNKESRVIWTAPADIADYFDGDPVLYIAVKGSNFTDTGTYTLTVVSSGPPVLISNLEQTSLSTDDIDLADGGEPGAQSFTTGPRTGGYALTGISVVSNVRATTVPAGLVATIRADSGGNPGGTVLATLTNPVSLPYNVEAAFTAPANTTLAANTTY